MIRKKDGFSEFEKRILEVFVTSATEPVYALKCSIPPEMFGAFGSFFSRSSRDLRVNLLDALRGKIHDSSEVVPDKDLLWLAKGGFREPQTAIETGLKRSRDFYREWYGKWGHKSSANMAHFPMVGIGRSQLSARELAGEELAWFIEQSTRYVKFKRDDTVSDPKIMGSEHSEVYTKAINKLFEAYDKVVGVATEYYKGKIPFDKWWTFQTDEIKREDRKVVERKYKREIRGMALDVARFLLPQASKTNIAWIWDARSAERNISAWKGHALDEMQDFGWKIETHAGKIIPSILDYTDENDYYGQKLRAYDGDLGTVSSGGAFSKGAEITASDPEALDRSVAYILLKHNRGGTFSQRFEEAKKMSFEKKRNLLSRIVRDRKSTDEFIEFGETFKMVPISFEIRSDIGAVRDLRRHQSHERTEALYTLDSGYEIPPDILDMGSETEGIFAEAVREAHEAEKVIREELPFQAQYVLPMATNHALQMTCGLDLVLYFLRQRTTPHANFSYRKDAFNLAEAVAKVHPWLLGYENYPQDKDFRKVYDKAPLKGLMVLQTGDSVLHE